MDNSDEDTFIEIAEEVFEDDEDICNKLLFQLQNINVNTQKQLIDTQRHVRVIRKLSSIPSYQASLLNTEYNLIYEDTGPLPVMVRHNIADIAITGQSQYSDNEKYSAIQEVDKIMAENPWALNKWNIKKLREVNLCLSEIVHALLIIAHTHSVTGIEAAMEITNKNYGKESKLKLSRHADENNYDNIASVGENHYFDILNGISCEQYWDTSGFPVLHYLYEDASYVIDRRFSAVEEIMKENTDISNYLYAVWSYSQQILGVGLDNYDKQIAEEVLDEDQKQSIHNMLKLSVGTHKRALPLTSSSLHFLAMVIVQEARMMVEVTCALQAVMQFIYS